MKTQLNLAIEHELIQQIKSYAAKKGISVSEIVEEYFKPHFYTPKNENFIEAIKKLPKPQITDDIDFKKAFYEELSSK